METEERGKNNIFLCWTFNDDFITFHFLNFCQLIGSTHGNTAFLPPCDFTSN